MKQNQKKRFNNGRFNNRNQQKQITRNTVFDSSGPCGKLRGTALQLVEKYQAGAKDALMQNDIVLAQTCMQFADHYIRLQNQAIQNEQRGNQNNQPRQREVESVDELPEIQLPEAKEVETQDELPEIQMPEGKDDLNEGEKVETALDGVVEKARDEKKPAFAEPKVEEQAESKEKSESKAGGEEKSAPKAGGEEKSSKTPNKPKPQIVKVKRRVKEVDQGAQMAASSLQEKPHEQVKEGEE